MNLHDVLMGVARRWYIVVVGILAAGGVGVALFLNVPPTYEQTSSSLLLPGSTTVDEGSNPLLFVGGLVQQRDLLVRAMEAEDVHDTLLESHPDGTFTVGPDYTTAGPVVTVYAAGKTPQATTAVMLAANKAVAAELEALQVKVGAPPSARTTMMELVTDESPTIIRKTQIRTTGGGIAAVLAASVLLAAFVDGRILARRRRREGAAEGDATAEADDEALDVRPAPAVALQHVPATAQDHAPAHAEASASDDPVIRPDWLRRAGRDLRSVPQPQEVEETAGPALRTGSP